MKEYFVATDDNGRVVTLEELGDFSDELEECDCDKCDQLEAAMLAIIQGLREKIAMLECRMTYLEKQPVQVVPMQPYYVPAPAPSTTDPAPWWETNRFTCKS